MNFITRTLLLLPLLAGGGICLAHNTPTPVDTLHALQPVNLDEVVVSVNREKNRKLFLPRQITTLRSAVIANANTRSMSDLLMERGSVTVQKSQQGGGSPVIRGFEASRVLLQVDNVRLNNLIYRTGHLQNAITVDQNMLERIEVLYGPASIAYGSDALGGTVHFHTRNPELRTSSLLPAAKGNAFIRYGSVNNELTSHLDINIAGKKFASLTSFTYSDFGDLKAGRQRNPFLPEEDDYIRLNSYIVSENGSDAVRANGKPHLQKYSGYAQYDLLQKFLYKPHRNTEHLINIQLSNSSDINRYDRLTETKNDKPKFAEWYYGPQFRLMTAYEVNSKEKLGADRTSLVLAYQHVEESRHNRRAFNDILNNRTESVEMLTLGTDWVKRIGTHTLHTGIDAMMSSASSVAFGENIRTGEISPVSTRYADGANRMHSAETYLTHTWNINPLWSMHNGARFGYSYLFARFNDKTFFPFLEGTVTQHNPTYSVASGINYLPAERWKLAFNIASGFRVPNIDDLAKVFDSQAGRVVVPNPGIRPEQTITADLNVTFHIDDHLVWENVGYGTYYFNAITLSPATLNGNDSILYDDVMSKVYTSRNARRAFVWGVSSTLRARLGAGFSAEGSVSYTRGRILEEPRNQPLDHIPPLFGRIVVSYSGLSDRMLVEFYSLFNGRKALKDYNTEGEDNINYATVKGAKGAGTPAWFTLNLKAGFRVHPQITVQGGIENLLDTEYRMFASGISSPGRNLYLTLRGSF